MATTAKKKPVRKAPTARSRAAAERSKAKAAKLAEESDRKLEEIDNEMDALSGQPVDRIHAAAQENAERRKAAEAAEAAGEAPPEELIDPYAPLLKLKVAKRKRPTIEIEDEDTGKVYEFELKQYREFGVGDQHDLGNDGETFDNLWAKPTLTKKEKDRLAEVLHRMFDKVFLKPEAMGDAEFKRIKDKLGDEERSQIVTTFTVAPLQIAARKAAAEAQAAELRQNATQEQTTPGT